MMVEHMVQVMEMAEAVGKHPQPQTPAQARSAREGFVALRISIAPVFGSSLMPSHLTGFRRKRLQRGGKIAPLRLAHLSISKDTVCCQG
jgi:tRNA U34 5-methylaminomethyl-2-thiouridine-forming methyltransferase MnmC